MLSIISSTTVILYSIVGPAVAVFINNTGCGMMVLIGVTVVTIGIYIHLLSAF